MLDLNVDTVKKNVYEDRQFEINSGTSVSSEVFNAGDDEPIAADDLEVDGVDAVSYSATDIVSQTEKSKENSHRSSVGSITRQFFPVSGYLEELDSRLITSSPLPVSYVGADWLNLKVPESAPLPPQKARKSRRGPPSKSSQYRGVTFYRRTGRWESHIWDCGKQLYLGGFDTPDTAARAYDRAAIKFRGPDADINFNLSDYEEDMTLMTNLSKEEFILILRRQSNGFSRGTSKYRGVTLHKCGRWEARMGQLLGKKAYDKAAIKCNGREAVTNFEPSSYGVDINSEKRDEGAESGHNLDLNLWVSASNGPKQNHAQNVELPSRKRAKVAPVPAASSGFSSVVNFSDHLFLSNKKHAQQDLPSIKATFLRY